MIIPPPPSFLVAKWLQVFGIAFYFHASFSAPTAAEVILLLR